ncbi:unnamed protein product, partial [marine sediment metagenome]
MYPPQGNKAGVDVSDADALVTDVKDPKTFYSVEAPKKTGTMPTKAIVAGAETYEEGYHAGNPGGLSAIDADLTPANIKKDVNIFGKVGTYDPLLVYLLHIDDRSSESDFIEIASGEVPATAKEVLSHLYVLENNATSDDSRIRVLYNGVVKKTVTTDVGYNDGYWKGTALGFAAALSIELYH